MKDDSIITLEVAIERALLDDLLEAAQHRGQSISEFVDTFCAHRIAEGEAPACCETCIGDARYFGDLNDPSSKVAQLAASPRAFRLREELGTNPSVYYLK